MDIVERLRFDAARCEAQFSKGVATNIEEAADEIERLRHGLTRIVCLSEVEKNEAPPDDTVAQVIARDTLNGHMA